MPFESPIYNADGSRPRPGTPAEIAQAHDDLLHLLKAQFAAGTLDIETLNQKLFPFMKVVHLPSSWKASDEPEGFSSHSAPQVVTNLSDLPPALRASILQTLSAEDAETLARMEPNTDIKEELVAHSQRQSNTPHPPGPRAPKMEFPESSRTDIKEEETETLTSLPSPVGHNHQTHPQEVEHIPDSQTTSVPKMKAIIASAVKRSKEDGKPEVGQTLNALFEQNTSNPIILDLLAAVCSGNASANKLKDFKVFMRYTKKLLDYERKKSQQDAPDLSTLTSEVESIRAGIARLKDMNTELEKSNDTGGDGIPKITEHLIKMSEALAEAKEISQFLREDSPEGIKHRSNDSTLSHEAKNGSDSGTEFPPTKKGQLYPDSDSVDLAIKKEELESSSDEVAVSLPHTI
ncbi:MAG: hypothetical protein L6R38_002767 [Xanthoria sp. 2 TBL-2021]|nr:MAG: hypothetical protein L6R38_002767 [Xanthoria sp. 2 TBL-2021]